MPAVQDFLAWCDNNETLPSQDLYKKPENYHDTASD